LVNIGMVILAAMVLLTVVDVFGRYLLNRPIVGSAEVTEVMMVSLSYFALVWCTMRKAHIKLDLLTEHIPPSVQTLSDIVFHLLGLGLFSFIAWQNFLMGRDNWLEGYTSWVLHIPNYPFYFVVAIACGMVALVLLLFIVQNIGQVIKRWT
jgi:TRAP-type C4-dicarboxylate transport system permease small subunit